jgi:rubrerythrin
MEAYMNLLTFLVGAVELEMATASIYERMAELLPNSSVGMHLKALANDENRNAGAIRIKCRFDQEITDSRIQIYLEDDKIKKRMADGVIYLNKLQPGFSISGGLEKMLDFERRVEEIHSAACRQIRNPSHKQLFMTLIKSNRSHIQTLSKLKEAHLSAPSGSRG